MKFLFPLIITIGVAVALPQFPIFVQPSGGVSNNLRTFLFK